MFRYEKDCEVILMRVKSCVPVIPSVDLEKSLRFWGEGLGFSIDSEMRQDDRLIFCMLENDGMWFMLNRRAGTRETPDDYEGIRLYWTPKSLQKTKERLMKLGYEPSEVVNREYGQTEFFVTDDDGYSHCFGVPTET